MADDAHQECSEPVGNPDISLEASHSFVQAGLGEYFCLCLKELEFIAPTPIQYYAIRTAIDRPERSIVAQAKSGTGKTLVYLSLIMQHLSCLLEL